MVVNEFLTRAIKREKPQATMNPAAAKVEQNNHIIVGNFCKQLKPYEICFTKKHMHT